MKPVDCQGMYRDGKHYDKQHEKFFSDLPFYEKRIKEYGDPVLEIACGTGRLTLALAQKGVDITGLDISEGMLEQAKKKAKEKDITVDFFHEDCRKFHLEKKFALIIFPFNSIAHLHDLESLEGCFSCVKNHLLPHGRFIIDIFNPRMDMLVRDPKKMYPVSTYKDPYSGQDVIITEKNAYCRASQINKILWYYKVGEKEWSEQLNMRMFFPQELDVLLYYNGFTLEKKYGEVDDSDFTSQSNKQLVVCHIRK